MGTIVSVLNHYQRGHFLNISKQEKKMQMCRSRPPLALIVLQVPAAGLSLAASPLALVLQPQRSGVVNQSFCRGYV